MDPSWTSDLHILNPCIFDGQKWQCHTSDKLSVIHLDLWTDWSTNAYSSTEALVILMALVSPPVPHPLPILAAALWRELSAPGLQPGSCEWGWSQGTKIFCTYWCRKSSRNQTL